MPPHVISHVVTMAQLHRDNRYDRFSKDVADWRTSDERSGVGAEERACVRTGRAFERG
jgi:hypothetical protein